MTIIPLFEKCSFNPESTHAMGIAYDKMCNELGLAHNGDRLNVIVAEMILKIAHTGERDPDKLRARAMELLKRPTA